MPQDLAFDSAGKLYVLNSNNTIESFSPTGTDLGIFASLSSTGASFSTGIAFDSAGSLYVANAGTNTVEKFSSTGADLGVFASTGLSAPTSLAFTDDNGLPLPLANQAPEPTTLALAAIGSLTLLGRNTRRRRN